MPLSSRRWRPFLLAISLLLCATTGALNQHPVLANQPPQQLSEDSIPEILSVSPEYNAFAVPVDQNITVTFSEAVYLDDSRVTLICSLGYSLSFTTNPPYTEAATQIEIDPVDDLPAGELCTLTIPAEAVVDLEYTNPMEGLNTQFITAGCDGHYDHIRWFRDGTVALDNAWITEGVVTAVTPGMGGYFIQDQNPPANDPPYSDGIFVYDPESVVAPGEVIRLYGLLQEYDSSAAAYGKQYQNTELALVAGIERCGKGDITPVVLDLPLAEGSLERYEGMLVTLPETLTVAQNYFQGRFGQVTLSADGRIFQPNNGQGGTRDDAVARMLVLDDGSRLQNPQPVPYYAVDGALRAGDTVSGLTGVLDQGRINAARADAPDFTPTFPYVYYRLHPTLPPVFQTANPRAPVSTPPKINSILRVAGFNVQNYFATLDVDPYPAGSPYDAENPPRGADSAAEFTRQQEKIAAALLALDADVIGLVEIEAWDGADAVNNLVQALNERAGADIYAAVSDPLDFPHPQPSPAAGGDLIRVALIYKPAALTPLGPALVDIDAVYSRAPLAQTFQVNASSEVFSVVVNHFKSKSSCPLELDDPNRDSGQGCWNELRIQQAERLLAFVTRIQGASGDPDVLVIGDLNAYGAEDPIATLTKGGLTNLVAAQVPAQEQYSTIFDGQSGYLDHALATASLTGQVVGAAFWHINADEPALIDYNTEYKSVDFYAGHAFRSSDHDPLLVGLYRLYQYFFPLVGR